MSVDVTSMRGLDRGWNFLIEFCISGHHTCNGAVLESLADDVVVVLVKEVMATLFGADRFAIGGHNPLREPKKSGKCRDECHAEANEIDHGILGDGEALGLLIEGELSLTLSIEPAVVVTRLAVENPGNLACRLLRMMPRTKYTVVAWRSFLSATKLPHSNFTRTCSSPCNNTHGSSGCPSSQAVSGFMPKFFSF